MEEILNIAGKLLEDKKYKELFNVVLWIFVIVAPSYSYTFMYRRELFYKLDTTKLLLLCVLVNILFIIFNYEISRILLRYEFLKMESDAIKIEGDLKILEKKLYSTREVIHNDSIEDIIDRCFDEEVEKLNDEERKDVDKENLKNRIEKRIQYIFKRREEELNSYEKDTEEIDGKIEGEWKKGKSIVAENMQSNIIIITFVMWFLYFIVNKEYYRLIGNNLILIGVYYTVTTITTIIEARRVLNKSAISKEKIENCISNTKKEMVKVITLIMFIAIISLYKGI